MRQKRNIGQMSLDLFESPGESDFIVNAAPEPDTPPNTEGDDAGELSIHRGDMPADPLVYISFGSGSSGNSCYIGTRRAGILVDGGVRPEFISAAMKENALPEDAVKAVIVTHDHSDHVRYIYKILRQLRGARLFCTNRVMQGMLRRHNISRFIRDYHQPIFKEIPFKVAEFEITAFEVPHDGTDNMGFIISREGRNFVVATDLGAVEERAGHYIGLADYLMIEANYDSDMLANGPYPQYLKARIRTRNGHLDNRDTAACVARTASSRRLSHVFLCHLSKDNNTPSHALTAVRTALLEAGLSVGDGTESIEDRAADIHLTVLPRFDATRLFIL